MDRLSQEINIEAEEEEDVVLFLTSILRRSLSYQSCVIDRRRRCHRLVHIYLSKKEE